MADRHRIGVFADTDPATGINYPTGRFTTLLDVNDLATFAHVRGSFKVQPFQEAALYSQSTRRYGGSKPIGETHDNGTIAAVWMITGATADACLAAKDQLFEYFESTRRDLFYEWRPDGATHSTYYELRGGLPWDPQYEWATFAGSKCLQVSGGWQVAPLARMAPMDILDTFDEDTIAAGDWTQDAGTATISGSLGIGFMSWAATGTKVLRHTGRGYELTDVQLTANVTTGASVTSSGAALILRYLDSSNYLFAQLEQSNLRIYKTDGGATTQLATVAHATATGTSYWVRFRAEGDILYAEVFTGQPTPLGTPTASVSYTLTGANATKFGAGIAGDIGMRNVIVDTGFRVNSFEALPYAYRRAGSQTVAAHEFDLYDVPGTAPALVDIYTTSPSGTEPESALIAWATNLNPGEVVDRPIRLIDYSGTADANSSGGAYQATLTPGFVVYPEYMPSDDFTDTVSVEVWVIVKTNGTGGGTVVLSAAPFLNTNHKIYTPEYGSAGHTFKTIAGGRVITRAGILTFPSGPSGDGWLVSPTLSGGSVQGIDAAIVVPARQRACTPTGQAAADSQKWLDPGSADTYEKRIRSDLSGAIRDADSASRVMWPDAGLSGQLLEFPPGDVRVLHRLGTSVVDATDVASTETLASSSMAVRYSVWPRTHLARAG